MSETWLCLIHRAEPRFRFFNYILRIVEVKEVKEVREVKAICFMAKTPAENSSRKLQQKGYWL